MTLRSYSLPVFLIGYIIGLYIIAAIAISSTVNVIVRDVKSDFILVWSSVVSILLVPIVAPA